MIGYIYIYIYRLERERERERETPSLISLVVFVDVKDHVYLLI